MGGDEFAVTLGTISNFDDAGQVAQKILEVICLPITLPNGTVERIGASIGSDNIAGLISKPHNPSQLQEVLKGVMEGMGA